MSDITETLHPGEDNYIPCYPFVSNANMTLRKFGSDKKIPLEFDPTSGFIVSTVTQEFDGHFECEAQYENRTETHGIQLTRLGKFKLIYFEG